MKSLFKTLKNLPEPLRKSGQYIKLPEEIFRWVDDGKRIPKAKREKYERLLTGGGKLKPTDLDRLVEAGHPDVINSVVQRNLNKEEALKVLGVANFKSPKTYTRREEVNSLTRKLINKYVAHGNDAVNEVFANGAAPAVNRIMRNNPNNVTHEALMTIARRDIAPKVLHGILDNRKYDDEVARVLASHPDANTASTAITNVIRDGGENKQAFMSLALQHPNEEVTSNVLNSRHAAFSPDHIGQMLNHDNPGIRLQAMQRVMKPEHRDHVLDNLMGDRDSFDKNMKAFLAQGSSPWKKRYSWEEAPESEFEAPTIFDKETMHKIVDKAVGNRSFNVLKSDAFWDRVGSDDAITADDHFDASHLNKIASVNWNDEELGTSHRSWEVGTLWDQILKNVSDNDQGDVLRTLSNNESFKRTVSASRYGSSRKSPNEWSKRLATQPGADADFLRELWQRSDKGEGTQEKFGSSSWDSHHDIYESLARNPNTPQDVLHDILDNYSEKIHHGTAGLLAKHKNLAPERLEDFMAHEDPNIRMTAASSAAATPEQIARGLKDKRKEVRAQWLRHPNITDENLRPLLKDRAQGNRISLASHGKMSGDLLHEMISNDKSWKVREQAMKHPNVTPETIEWMMQNDTHPDLRKKALSHHKATPEAMMRAFDASPNAEVITAMLSRGRNSPDQEDFTPEQYEKMRSAISTKSAELVEKRNQLDENGVREFKDGYRYGSGYRGDPETPVALGHQLSKYGDLYRTVAARNGEVRKKAVLDENLPLSVLSNIIEKDTDLNARNGEGVLGRDHLLAAYNRIDRSSEPHHHLLEYIMEHDAYSDSGIEDRLINDSNPTAMRSAVDKFENFSDENKLRIINKVRDDDRSSIIKLLERADKKEHFDALLQKGDIQITDTNAMRAVASNENADDVTLGRIYDRSVETGNARLAQIVINNPRVGGDTIRKAMAHEDPNIARYASNKFAYEDPNAVNESVRHHESHGEYSNIREVHTHPAVEKLKHIKGIVEDLGGSVHKKELEKKGFGGLPNIWDNKGHVTPETVDRYIDTLPKHRYNISWDYWGGERNSTAHRSSYNGLQRHDDSKTQKVIQVNLTNDQIEQMKQAGVHDLYKQMHSRGFSSSHPVRHHSMGWARVDDSHEGHWHIDEVQSDVWSTIMGEAHRVKTRGGSDEEKKEKMGKLKSLVKILQGPFKNPNHSIVCAAHEIARQNGVKSTSMDMPEDQFSQSGKRGNVDSAKFKFTYQQWPRDNKYAEKDKKETMPNTEGLEPTLQYRKLVKSMQRVKELLKLLEDDAS